MNKVAGQSVCRARKSVAAASKSKRRAFKGKTSTSAQIALLLIIALPLYSAYYALMIYLPGKFIATMSEFGKYLRYASDDPQEYIVALLAQW